MRSEGKSEEEVKAFETGAQGYVKKLFKNIKSIDFYLGENGVRGTDENGRTLPQM